MTFQPFASWKEVLDAVKPGAWVHYHAPMDIVPRRVLVSKVYKNGKVRINPMSSDADSFNADARHLSRFLRAL